MLPTVSPDLARLDANLRHLDKVFETFSRANRVAVASQSANVKLPLEDNRYRSSARAADFPAPAAACPVTREALAR